MVSDQISQEALAKCLSRLAEYARKKGATSIHMPRIGYGMQNIQWYIIERLIRKYLTAKRIGVYIYYFRRGTARVNTEEGLNLFALFSLPVIFYVCKFQKTIDRTKSGFRKPLDVVKAEKQPEKQNLNLAKEQWSFNICRQQCGFCERAAINIVF